jgi:hypothetical protein
MYLVPIARHAIPKHKIFDLPASMSFLALALAVAKSSKHSGGTSPSPSGYSGLDVRKQVNMYRFSSSHSIGASLHLF